MERSGSRSSVRGSKEQLQAEEKVDVFTEEPFWPVSNHISEFLPHLVSLVNSIVLGMP